MATKWEINKAVRASGLPAPSRLIMLTLSDISEVGTAEIPERHTPSLRVLAEETGLDRSTVKRHLASLEADGWITRSRPTIEAARYDHARTAYRLTIPLGAESAQPGAEKAKTMAQRAPRHGAESAQGMAHSAPLPYIPDHYQTNNHSSSAKPPTRTKKRTDRTAKTDRPDVEKICEHLADRIVANGSLRPEIGKRWRDAARLLLDKDGRTIEQVIKAIDWCQDHEFWRANIKSMPKLREQYDTLRLQAKRTTARASPKDDLTEHNGLMLKASNVANVQRAQRMAALDAQRQAAIEGPR